MSAAAQFTVTAHHLAADLRGAGPEFKDTEPRVVTADGLRGLVEAFAALAPSVQYPAEPELRIVGPHGRFLLQARNGEMRVSSWSAQAAGANLSPRQILALILGVEEAEDRALPASRDAGGGGRRIAPRWKVAGLALAVLASNGVTAWLLTRPPARLPPELLPAYQLVAPERAGRVLADFAGDYETGQAEGDRHLTILRDGRLRWFKWGVERAVTDELMLTAQAAESRGRPVLVADNSGMIEMKDPITIVYFGDTYRRKSP